MCKRIIVIAVLSFSFHFRSGSNSQSSESENKPVVDFPSPVTPPEATLQGLWKLIVARMGYLKINLLNEESNVQGGIAEPNFESKCRPKARPRYLILPENPVYDNHNHGEPGAAKKRIFVDSDIHVGRSKDRTPLIQTTKSDDYPVRERERKPSRMVFWNLRKWHQRQNYDSKIKIFSKTISEGESERPAVFKYRDMTNAMRARAVNDILWESRTLWTTYTVVPKYRYPEGKDLSCFSALADFGKSISELTRLTPQIVQLTIVAIQTLHDFNILHRSITPESIRLMHDGTITFINMHRISPWFDGKKQMHISEVVSGADISKDPELQYKSVNELGGHSSSRRDDMLRIAEAFLRTAFPNYFKENFPTDLKLLKDFKRDLWRYLIGFLRFRDKTKKKRGFLGRMFRGQKTRKFSFELKLIEFYEKMLNLKFEQRPNYSKLIELFDQGNKRFFLSHRSVVTYA